MTPHRTTFEPAVHPPEPPHEGDLVFAFQGDQLLVLEQDGSAQVPTRAQLPAALAQSEHYLGASSGHPCYAIELVPESDLPADTRLSGLRELFGAIDEDLFWVAGTGVQIIAWHQTHQFCGRCGEPTQHHPQDRARQCPQCKLTAFPRLSPAIIVRIEREGSILLARNHRFPKGRYSVLAGFVEPGENLEQAVAREVREEVGLVVDDIRYFASQPWPFPNSLMLGFTARYASGDIVLEEAELADAQWFTPDTLPELPPSISIARELIDDYLDHHDTR
ncbi:MAG: NAD(+) diphosphatase [Candidatus Latescibacteria bacterium]|nr:NAD(+) diphosphatase [Candidatus Latescibacterota bacterium]